MWNRGAGPKNFQRSLPTSAILWLCDSSYWYPFSLQYCSIFAIVMKESYFIPVLTRSSLIPSLYLRKGEKLMRKKKYEKNYSKNILNFHFWSELPLFAFIIWTILLFCHYDCEFLTFTVLQQLLQFSQTFQNTLRMYYTPSVFGLGWGSSHRQDIHEIHTIKVCWHSDSSLSQISFFIY